MKTITKHYIDHPFLSRSIYPVNTEAVNEKQFDGNYAEDDKEESEENWIDREDDSIYALHNQIKK